MHCPSNCQRYCGTDRTNTGPCTNLHRDPTRPVCTTRSGICELQLRVIAGGVFNPVPPFPFSGSVGPVYPLSAKRTVPKSIRQPDYAAPGVPTSERMLNRAKVKILDDAAQQAMRKVFKLFREVLDIVAAEVKPGVTTDYLDEVCHKACLDRNVRSPGKISVFMLAHQPLEVLSLAAQIRLHVAQRD